MTAVLTAWNGPLANLKVCIVGGGMAGLQTAKILEDIGVQCVIFEKRSELGGVWCVPPN